MFHGTYLWYRFVKRKHSRILEALFSHPTPANIPWRDIESMFAGLDAKIRQREGSRVAVILFGQVQVFHRPHPSPNADKGAITSIRMAGS
jgi:hypothetical protein